MLSELMPPDWFAIDGLLQLPSWLIISTRCLLPDEAENKDEDEEAKLNAAVR